MIGAVPVHVPSVVDKTCPSLAVPDKAGFAVFEGAAALTTALA